MKITATFSAFGAALLLGLSALAPIASPLHAQAADTAEAQTSEEDVYDSLYDAIGSGVNEQDELDALMLVIVGEISKDPASAGLEQVYPGAITAMVAGMRPTFDGFSKRIKAQYRPQMIQIFREVLTLEEARIASRAYSSEIGKKLMANATTNMAGGAMISEALADKDITQAAVAEDMEAAGREAASTLSQAELLEFAKDFQQSPTLPLKMETLKTRVFALRTLMENEAMTAEEERVMGADGEAALLAYIAAADAEN